MDDVGKGYDAMSRGEVVDFGCDDDRYDWTTARCPDCPPVAFLFASCQGRRGR